MTAINVLLKRTNLDETDNILTISTLSIDTDKKTVIRGTNRIDLTAREYMLLLFFVKNKGKLLSRDTIIKNVWDIDFDPGTNVLDVYINYLRRKIDRDYEPKLIHTKFGFGFYCNDTEI